MKTLRKNKYSFFLEKDNGEYLIFNAQNGFIMRCNETEYIAQAKAIENSPIIECTEDNTNDLIKLLSEKDVLVDMDYSEEMHVNALYENHISRRNILSITLFMTRQCNFRCTYCGQDHEDMEMTDEIYERILQEIERYVDKVKVQGVSISYFGGEPLLKKDKMLHFSKRVKEIAEKYNVRVMQGMSTNGYLLSKSTFIELIEHGINGFQICIDGLKATHDNFRRLTNGSGTWQAIIDNLKFMKNTEHPFNVVLRTNYNEELLLEANEFYEFIKSNFDDKRYRIYYETIKKHNEEVDTLNLTEGVVSDISLANSLNSNELHCANAIERTLPCSTVCMTTYPLAFAIDCDGTIRKCTHLIDDNPVNMMGNIKENNLDPMDEKTIPWTANYSLLNSECSECKIKPLCFGKRCPAGFILNKAPHACSELETLRTTEIIKNFY